MSRCCQYQRSSVYLSPVVVYRLYVASTKYLWRGSSPLWHEQLSKSRFPSSHPPGAFLVGHATYFPDQEDRQRIKGNMMPSLGVESQESRLRQSAEGEGGQRVDHNLVARMVKASAAAKMRAYLPHMRIASPPRKA